MFEKTKDFIKYRIIYDFMFYLSIPIATLVGSHIPRLIVRYIIKIILLSIEPILFLVRVLEHFSSCLLMNTSPEDYSEIERRTKGREWLDSL